jgi:hypothetical protein
MHDGVSMRKLNTHAPPQHGGEQMRNPFRSKGRIAVIGATAAIALAGAGTAFAYFTATGSGSASGSVGSTTGWAVQVNDPSGPSLYPGSGTETFSYTVTNTSGGNQELNQVVITATANSAGCDSAWYVVDGSGSSPTNTVAVGIGQDIASGASYSGTITLQLADVPTSQNACEGDAPTVTVVAR